MEKLRKIISPGHEQDDEILYGDGQFSNKDKVAGEGSHFGPSGPLQAGTLRGGSSQPAPAEHTSGSREPPPSRVPGAFEDDEDDAAATRAAKVAPERPQTESVSRPLDERGSRTTDAPSQTRGAGAVPEPVVGSTASTGGVEAHPGADKSRTEHVSAVPAPVAGSTANTGGAEAHPEADKSRTQHVSAVPAPVAGSKPVAGSTADAGGVEAHPGADKSQALGVDNGVGAAGGSKGYSTAETSGGMWTSGMWTGTPGHGAGGDTATGGVAPTASQPKVAHGDGQSIPQAGASKVGAGGAIAAGGIATAASQPKAAHEDSQSVPQAGNPNVGAGGAIAAGGVTAAASQPTAAHDDGQPIPEEGYTTQTSSFREPGQIGTYPPGGEAPGKHPHAGAPATATHTQPTDSASAAAHEPPSVAPSQPTDNRSATAHEPSPAATHQPTESSNQTYAPTGVAAADTTTPSRDREGETLPPGDTRTAAAGPTEASRDPSLADTGPAPNTAGPHKYDILNKLDPRVDSDLSKQKDKSDSRAPSSELEKTKTESSVPERQAGVGQPLQAAGTDREVGADQPLQGTSTDRQAGVGQPLQTTSTDRQAGAGQPLQTTSSNQTGWHAGPVGTAVTGGAASTGANEPRTGQEPIATSTTAPTRDPVSSIGVASTTGAGSQSTSQPQYPKSDGNNLASQGVPTGSTASDTQPSRSEDHTARNAALGAGAATGATAFAAHEQDRHKPGGTDAVQQAPVTTTEPRASPSAVPPAPAEAQPTTTAPSQTKNSAVPVAGTGAVAHDQAPDRYNNVSQPSDPTLQSAAQHPIENKEREDRKIGAVPAAGAGTAGLGALESEKGHPVAGKNTTEPEPAKASDEHTGRNIALGAGAGAGAVAAAEHHGDKGAKDVHPAEEKAKPGDKSTKQDYSDTGEKKPGLVDRILHRHPEDKDKEKDAAHQESTQPKAEDQVSKDHPRDEGHTDEPKPSSESGGAERSLSGGQDGNLGTGKTTHEAYSTTEGHNKLHKDPPTKVLKEHGLQ